MMKFICYILLCLGFSCKRNDIPESIKQFYGKEISYEGVYDKEALLFEDPDLKFTIIHYIDSSQCAPCMLENLNLWKKHEEELKEFQIKVVLITNHPDQGGIHQILKELQIPYSIYFDPIGEFKKQNQLPSSPIYQTFTVDQSNRVCWLGLPIENEKTWNLYKQMLKQYYNK